MVRYFLLIFAYLHMWSLDSRYFQAHTACFFAQGDFGYLSFFLLAEVFFPAIAFFYDNLLENVKKNTI